MVFVLAALTVQFDAAWAHKTSLARGDFELLEGGVKLTLVLSPHDLAIALGQQVDLDRPLPERYFETLSNPLEGYLEARLRVTSGHDLCPLDNSHSEHDPPGDKLVLILFFACADVTGPIRVDYLLFFEVDPKHRALGSFTQPSGQELLAFDRSVTRFETPVAIAPQKSSAIRHFLRLLLLGGEHILIGWDHLLFLLLLVLAPAHPIALVGLISTFTLAHSLTLALAWYGLLRLPGPWVEAAIAFSIIWLAAENLLLIKSARRWIWAGLFGLVHGLGFYGVLSTLDLGREREVGTLLGFNLGVEIGQILALALIMWPLWWGWKKAWWPRFRQATGAAIGLIAVALLLERIGSVSL